MKQNGKQKVNLNADKSNFTVFHSPALQFNFLCMLFFLRKTLSWILLLLRVHLSVKLFSQEIPSEHVQSSTNPPPQTSRPQFSRASLRSDVNIYFNDRKGFS